MDRWSEFVASVDSVRRQTLPPSQIIVVIDHNPEMLARSRETFPDLTVVENDYPPGLSGARDTGLAMVTADKVAFIDDDAMARETWLEELAAGYSAANVLGVGGLITPLWEQGGRPGWFPEEFDWVIGCTYRGMPEGPTVRNLIGTNMSFRTDVLASVGGFRLELGHTSTQALGGEEAGACIRAARLYPGGAFVYAPRAHVDHRVLAERTTWRYFRERCWAEGISKARLSRWVGSRDGLSTERHHVFVTLPSGVGRAVWAFLKGDAAGLARAAAIVAGLAFTAGGYVAGRLARRARMEPASAAEAPRPAPVGGLPARPKVLMVTPRYLPHVGGVELHVAQVARLMAPDADVTVLTTDTTGELAPTEVLDGVKVVRVGAWPRGRDYYFAPRIWGVIARGGWDLVHVQSYHSAVAPLAMLAALRARIPYVLTFHGGGHSSRMRTALRPLQWGVLRPLIARARKLIAVADFEAEQFSARLRIPRERFVVIPNGSDLSDIPVIAERRRSGDRFTIVSVGRLERYKGHQRVIEAMPSVLRRLPGSQLLVIGSGPYEPDLVRLVAELGLGDKVTIKSIPTADRQAMAQALVWCSLIVLMSEYETHPLAVVEALQLGRPALVADTSGLQELAEEGHARSIPLEATSDELADSIVQELRHPHAIQAIAVTRWEECADRLLALYRETLASRTGGGPIDVATTDLDERSLPTAGGAYDGLAMGEEVETAPQAEAEAEAEADLIWAWGMPRWRWLAAQAFSAMIGVGCVAVANAAASRGMQGTQALWWLGVLAVFTPAAVTLLFARPSRTEATFTLLVAGIALYAVKLLYAPGVLWEYDELLHYRTVDDILITHRLFAENPLLPVSPYYPGMETVTAAIVQLTGMSIVQSGLIFIGVARVLTVIAVFLLFERIAGPTRFAAPATLLYMASPAFLYFDAQFAYESLALAMSLLCMFALREAQLADGSRRRGLNAVGALLFLSVVATHHVTSIILSATLLVWVLFELPATIRSDRREEGLTGEERGDLRPRSLFARLGGLPGGGWVPLLGAVAASVWLLGVAGTTISYLWLHVRVGFTELVRVIRLEQTGRVLFESSGGAGTPLLERTVGIGSVLVIFALLTLGVRHLWKRSDRDPLARLFTIGSLAYLATLALRFTRGGWEIGARAAAFVYVPLAFTVAAGMEHFISRRHSATRSAISVFAMSVIFAGGIVAASSPVTRQPAPYNPGRAMAAYDAESLADADWAANVLGPGHRFVADSAGGVLVGSVGRQRLVTSIDGVSVSEFFLSPGLDPSDRAIARKGRVEYVWVDKRVAGVVPLKGFVYEKWERQVRGYGSSVSSATVAKFEVLRDASKEFDGGDIEVFDLHRLTQ